MTRINPLGSAYVVLALIVLLALVGCAGRPKSVELETRDVNMPVPVECAPEVAERQTYADKLVPLDADIYELARALLIGINQRDEDDLPRDSALKGCAGKD